ncbi:rod shape-determining protein MreD [Paenilisteria rocourtiae]|uniref:Rod shape-determining protein MreD n=1 Tax=Listeria rocourtiae TaxID=647910 RepID=A0A4R6ZMH2_9LIST|nr:rod shape-determining protein MreD [Listeria rocourtiae]EUJ51669.1 cell shape-determining protein MreD [Listeria rocourtiae FSL F6-920]MBC1434425.1 rod shape-determining protein MreD [Listeria rocourtiae]MBC1603915.1 rod shape-determining protein MreD [Listeria rocourtiae]TDR53578.1 rod shape-determining protein MreD [Listeria rocourtiae]
MNMRKVVVMPLIAIAVFILEGVSSMLFSQSFFGEQRVFIPHFLIVMLVLMATFYNRNVTLIYAFILGIVFDIYYTGILGIYFAIFPLVVYLTDKFMKVLQSNIMLVGLVAVFNVILTECLVYGFYVLIGGTDMVFATFVDQRLWTTILLNLAFFLVIYFPFRNFLFKLERNGGR